MELSGRVGFWSLGIGPVSLVGVGKVTMSEYGCESLIFGGGFAVGLGIDKDFL